MLAGCRPETNASCASPCIVIGASIGILRNHAGTTRGVICEPTLKAWCLRDKCMVLSVPDRCRRLHKLFKICILVLPPKASAYV